MSKKPAVKKKPVEKPPAAVLKATSELKPAVAPPPTKLDLGCGSKKIDGYFGVDQFKMPGVDLVWDLGDRNKRWPFADDSVQEIQSSHFFEHLSQDSRSWFMNEAFRVLAPGGQMKITTPYWASSRAYGDPSHTWPPVGEMTFYYFNREWRLANAPHVDISWNGLGLSCDFDHSPSYNVHGSLRDYSLDRQLFEVSWYKEAAQDIVALLVKRAPPPSFK